MMKAITATEQTRGEIARMSAQQGLPRAERAMMIEAERVWQEEVRQEFARTTSLLFSEGNSDTATEAAEHLWAMLDDHGRARFLRWCADHFFRIGNRPFGRVLARSWARPKHGSLVSWGFGIRELTWLFTLTKAEHLMESADLAEYQKLPNEVVAYRGVAGCSIRKAAFGMSWTLDQDRAMWFANRYPKRRGEPLCIRGTIGKSNVLAYFDIGGRGEREIVVACGRVSRVEPVSN